MRYLMVAASILCVLVMAPAETSAQTDAPRAKGVKSQRVAQVSHPKGKVCPKTGQPMTRK